MRWKSGKLGNTITIQAFGRKFGFMPAKSTSRDSMNAVRQNTNAKSTGALNLMYLHIFEHLDC